MGTNYYWESDRCDCCGHIKHRLHLCKSYTTIQAHFSDTYTEDPVPLPDLHSWGDWKAWILDQGGRIVDEYGFDHDTAEFIDQMDQMTPEARRLPYDRHVEYAASDPFRSKYSPRDTHRRADPNGFWLDPDGYFMVGYEFS